MKPLASPAGTASFASAWLTDLQFRWDPLLRGCRELHLDKDAVLFHEGQSARVVYVVEEGRIRLSSFAVDGRERHLMIMGTSGLVGDCGLPSIDRYVVTAIASSEARVRAVPADALMQALTTDPVLARQHQTLSSRRHRVLLRQLDLQGHNSASRRVCHHLLGLAQAYGSPSESGVRIGLTFTQQEMGNICGLSRVSVSNIFSRLEREGLIERQGRHLVLTDVRTLQQRATRPH
jgi:CRP/FNR family cyclic AMP-dependent transcriptional regulator